MNKGIKIIFIATAVLILIGIVGSIVLLNIIKDRNANYFKYSKPLERIEMKYTKLGSYDVAHTELAGENSVHNKYIVWYPTELINSKQTYPVVVMANGTGTKASQYQEVFKHLASWGFIVIGNDDENSRTGESSAATLDYILNLNTNINSVFYGKIDKDNIGIAGHSQGGVGAINAVTNQTNGKKFKAIFAASTTSRYHANELNKVDGGWSIDPSRINVPIFMVAGTELFDAGNMIEFSSWELPEGSSQGISPLWWLIECYDAIPESNQKVIARMLGKDHGDMLHSADAYMTSWFRYWLQGDKEAGEVFVGLNAEILNNRNYQDVQSNIE